MDSFLEEPANAGLRERGFTLRLLDPQGQPRQTLGPYDALPIPAESVAAAQQGGTYLATLTDPVYQTPVRLYTAPIERDNKLVGIIQVAQSLAEVQDTLRRLFTSLLISGPLLVIVAGLRILCPMMGFTAAP